jgi:hypothetical protein
MEIRLGIVNYLPTAEGRMQLLAEVHTRYVRVLNIEDLFVELLVIRYFARRLLLRSFEDHVRIRFFCFTRARGLSDLVSLGHKLGR